jgi:hypothetical protein
MTTLAGQMAARRNAVPVSDDLLSHVAIGAATMDGMVEALLNDDATAPASGRQAQILMADLAIRTVVPTNLENVPATKLIAFRQRYASERASFQDQVQSLVDGLAIQNITEPAALQDHLRIEYQKLLQPHIDDLRSRLRGTRIDTTTAIFNIKTNLTGIAGAAALDFLDAPKLLTGAGAVALSVWSVRREYGRNRRALLNEHPAASYLYHVHTDLSPEGLARRIGELGHRFWG